MSRIRTVAATALLALGLVLGAVVTAVPATSDVQIQAARTQRTQVGYYVADGKLCIIYSVLYLDGPRTGETEVETVCTPIRRLV
jgi:hypothetical protein